MHSRTRNLLKLLADETTDAILGELRKGPRTEAQLVAGSPGGRGATRTSLHDLELLELIGSEKAPPTGKRGTRAKLFKVTAPELLKFCDAAEGFALALSEAKTEDLRRYVEQLPPLAEDEQELPMPD